MGSLSPYALIRSSTRAALSSRHGPTTLPKFFLLRPSIVAEAHLISRRSYRTSYPSRAMADSLTIKSNTFYRELAGLPTYVGAQFQDSNVVRVTTSTQDQVRKIRRQGTTNYILHADQATAVYNVESAELVASTLSPSGQRMAMFREIADQGAPEGKKRFVEIWSSGKLETSLEVTDVHGTFYADAEIKPDNGSESDPFAKYRFVPPLGEGYAGKRRSGIFLLRWDRSNPLSEPSVSPLRLPESGPHPEILSQPVFASDDRLFAVGYEYTPDRRLLGVKYCPNRLAGIWELRIPPTSSDTKSGEDETPNDIVCAPTKLTPAHISCRSPRVLEIVDGRSKLLLWIANPVGGPHASCSTLHVLDLDTNEQRVLVDTVWDPKPDEFPGIFATTLPPRPFLRLQTPQGTAEHIVLTSNWRSRTVVLLISLQDGNVQNLTPDEEGKLLSWNVLGTDGNSQVVCTRSSPSTPPELVIGRIDGSAKVKWQIIAKPTLSSSLEKELAKIESSVLNIPGQYPTETILLKSKDVDPNLQVPPCITVPHGGPHGATTTGFNAHHVLLVIDGYTLSAPNYTGSVGFGETYIRKLLGQIGTLDVQDCIASIKYLIELGITEAGQGRQFLSGGSHGGFLTAHLIGQYPDFFSAAVLRNPVITLGEISSSDIPDWYLEESGIPFEPTSVVTSEKYAKLWAMSPLSHVDKVKTPTLLLLGDKDARVSPTQGKTFYHALKGRGQDVEMLTFKEDSHPLESVEAQKVYFEATRDLFAKWRK